MTRAHVARAAERGPVAALYVVTAIARLRKTRLCEDNSDSGLGAYL